MKYRTKYGNLDFWDPYPNLNKFKKIGINLSGGTDSALVMFMTCREIVERKLDAVIVPKNRSCHLTPVVRKISTGASELIPFVVVTNLVRTINKLQKNGLIIYGADLSATESHDEVEYSRKKGIVIGSEDKGIRKLTRDNCDQLVKINMSERIESLNASVSAGVLLFEMRRQIKINS